MSAAQTAATAQIDTFFAEYAKSIDGFVEMGTKAIEKAAQQNTELVAAWKKGLGATAEALQQAAKSQRDLLAVGIERVQEVSRLATENVESVKKTLAGVAASFEPLSEVTASVQRQATEIAAAQKTAYETATRQLEESGSAALENFQRGVETLVETRRSVLKSARNAS